MIDDNFLLIMGTIFFSLYFCRKTTENFSQNGAGSINRTKFDSIYSTLKSEWYSIFPNSNRNSGGVQFFNYIYEKIKPTKEEFDIYNKLYCGVSGSLIAPERIFYKSEIFKNKNSANDLVRIKHINEGYRCGYYYRCCWPCSCDIMNEDQVNVLVEDMDLQLKDGTYKYSVLTIPDPCSNSVVINDKEVLSNPKNKNKEWKQVSSFNCENKKTTNSTKSNSGRIIFAILFDSFECSEQQYKNHISFDKKLFELCKKRNDSEDGLQNWGMGDIFVSLAKRK